MSDSNKSFPETLAALWTSKSGKQYRSMEIDARAFDQIQKVLSKVELGGRIVFKVVPEERRKNDKSPQGYVEYLTKAQVEEEKRRLAEFKNNSL